MSNTNVTIIDGRLTKDGEKKIVGNNGTVAVDICVASSIYEKDAEYTNYFYLTIFGRQGENLYNNGFLKKGQFVAIKAHLKQDRWEKDGKQMSLVKIVPENVEIIGYPSGHIDKAGNLFKAVQNGTANDAPVMNEKMPDDNEIPFESSDSGIF